MYMQAKELLAHVKDLAVHVRVWWIMETPGVSRMHKSSSHQTCEVGHYIKKKKKGGKKPTGGVCVGGEEWGGGGGGGREWWEGRGGGEGGGGGGRLGLRQRDRKSSNRSVAHYSQRLKGATCEGSSWHENRSCESISTCRLCVAILSIYMQQKLVFYSFSSTSNLCSSGHSQIGSLVANGEQKSVGLHILTLFLMSQTDCQTQKGSNHSCG